MNEILREAPLPDSLTASFQDEETPAFDPAKQRPVAEVIEPPKKGRGRPKKETRSLEGVEKLLVSIHFMLATTTGLEDLSIDQSEAHILADALATLADHYKIKLDGKTGALMGFVYAIGAVYGPRAVTIGIKLRSKGNKSNG